MRRAHFLHSIQQFLSRFQIKSAQGSSRMSSSGSGISALARRVFCFSPSERVMKLRSLIVIIRIYQVNDPLVHDLWRLEFHKGQYSQISRKVRYPLQVPGYGPYPVSRNCILRSADGVPGGLLNRIFFPVPWLFLPMAGDNH